MKRITRKSVGEMIRRERQSMGLLQTELAKKMKISQPKLSKIETGKLVPDVIEFDLFRVAVNQPRVFG
tara:strand:+ start:19496 stop:19699 length:204 start_codon:yes stop_codon:yes gene_type:complete